MGSTYSLSLLQGNDKSGKTSDLLNAGSLTSKLVCLGLFQQTATGSILIYLNSTMQTSPVLGLTSNRTLGGTINVQFYESAQAKVTLFNTIPSKWALVQYLQLEAPPKIVVPGVSYPVQFRAPAGLSVSSSLQSIAANYESNQMKESTVFTSSVQLTNIGCSQVNSYYEGYSEASLPYQCYICLSNSSCNLCGDGTCSLAGTCGGIAGTTYTTSTYCCANGCLNGGVCRGSNGYNSFSCDCTVWFTGPSCASLSVQSIVLITVGAFIIASLIISKFLFDKYTKQKAQVLNEIRNNILNPTTGTSMNSDYIQHMQQALILNDVFVKYDEIKNEEKIGEGSFGVVYKATFRGAQVAVKKMKSLFIELSEKDMEEFKKEAYVMSRFDFQLRSVYFML